MRSRRRGSRRGRGSSLLERRDGKRIRSCEMWSRGVRLRGDVACKSGERRVKQAECVVSRTCNLICQIVYLILVNSIISKIVSIIHQTTSLLPPPSLSLPFASNLLRRSLRSGQTSTPRRTTKIAILDPSSFLVAPRPRLHRAPRTPLAYRNIVLSLHSLALPFSAPPRSCPLAVLLPSSP